jgi:hypothetical protein
MFTNNKEDKMGTTDSEFIGGNMDIIEKLWNDKKWAAQQAQMQQQYANQAQQYPTSTNGAQQIGYAQLQNAYGTASSNPMTWTTTANTYSPNTYSPVESTESVQFKQLMMLQVANLIANFGPTVAKKICLRFSLQITREEIDQIHKDLTRAIADDADPDLDKVINDVAKEVHL